MGAGCGIRLEGLPPAFPTLEPEKTSSKKIVLFRVAKAEWVGINNPCFGKEQNDAPSFNPAWLGQDQTHHHVACGYPLRRLGQSHRFLGSDSAMPNNSSNICLGN
jgi:hypothetical protein